MSNEYQWIPLSGPGGRLPTEDDADMEGCLYALAKKTTHRVHWKNHSYYPDTTHFCPIPKAPPLPKPREKTQEERDEAKSLSLIREWRSTPKASEELIIDAIRYGRSDGRAQLAREAMALFDGKHFYYGPHSAATSEGINLLHDLLTKATEAKP